MSRTRAIRNLTFSVKIPEVKAFFSYDSRGVLSKNETKILRRQKHDIGLKFYLESNVPLQSILSC